MEIEDQIEELWAENGRIRKQNNADFVRQVQVNDNVTNRITALEKSAAASTASDEPAKQPELSAYRKALKEVDWVSCPKAREFANAMIRSAAEAEPQGWSKRSDARTRAILALIETEN